MFTRNGSVLFRNEMKPFYWLEMKSIRKLTNRMVSFNFWTIWNRHMRIFSHFFFYSLTAVFPCCFDMFFYEEVTARKYHCEFRPFKFAFWKQTTLTRILIIFSENFSAEYINYCFFIQIDSEKLLSYFGAKAHQTDEQIKLKE